jgi:hypothetical protein
MKMELQFNDVASWRREQLIRSGFTKRDALRLATDPRYDLHTLIELVDGGCSPELAMRIVAPIDETAAAA